MDQYKILIEDRNCAEWSVVNAVSLLPTEIDESFEPIKHKLLNGDVFTYNNNNFKLIHSCFQSVDYMSGVLVLDKNKSYGRHKDKFLYKCIPDDRRLPSFIIPYLITKIGFYKMFKNKYITFKYKSWEGKHPMGMIVQLIGDVDKLENFYEYQLYCKSLYASIQGFTRATTKVLKDRSHEEFIDNIFEKYETIDNRIDDYHIFSIDSESTQDYDDAIGIKVIDENTKIMSIYISNVIVWMDILDLWSSFSKRVSTIYMPDRRRPMLPTILSECLCSLVENATRFAFTMDIIIENDNIKEIKYCNSAVNLFKNYIYDEDDLLNDKDYQLILETCRKLSKNKNYVSDITTSGDVVTYLMILMNHECGREMLKTQTGIFRSAVFTPKVEIPKHLPDDVYKFLHNWSNFSGQYMLDVPQGHEILKLESYIHITSPIRRLVDLLNLIKFQENHNILPLSEKAKEFYTSWTEQMEYINITMRAIRKVQTDCNLLEMCTNHPETLQKEYDGYLFDKIYRNDGLYQYIVFIPELRLTTRITNRADVENYGSRKFNLHIFFDEDRLKKKIRIQLLEDI